MGISDFATLRCDGYVYVDKSVLIADVVDSAAQVMLLPRPRRFGKTLAQSMLRYWFEGDRQLFEGLAILDKGARYADTCGRHPVIALSFKDLRPRTWAELGLGLGNVLRAELERLGRLGWFDALEPRQRETLAAWMDPGCDAGHYRFLLLEVSGWLARASGQQVVILLDEYDSPIHAAFAHGYYDDAIAFFRDLLSAGLKDNLHLYRGVLTGILRIAKESLFSGLNNLAVYGLFRPEFASAFGFTEAEVAALVEDDSTLDDIRRWYNGYRFGDEVIYNPWSVLSFLASADRAFRPHWVSAGGHDLIRELLIEQGLDLHLDLEALLAGEALDRPILEDLVLPTIRRSADAIWSFLLFTGYLRADDYRRDGRTWRARLTVPNEEVAEVYAGLFRDWLSAGLGGSRRTEWLCDALLSGDAEQVEEQLGDLMAYSLSYHDVGGRQAEAVYQAFIVGLLVQMRPDHEVRSNPESGYGRADVLIAPRRVGQPGAVLELKVRRRSETMEQALERAGTQIVERRYRAALEAAGAEPIHELAVVFDRKEVRVRRVAGSSAE